MLGARPPEGFNYEMFLDEKGEKISKSKGNGLSLDQWLTYGPQESLAFYIYREPKRAKSLHMGVIPRAIDDYWQFRGQLAGAGTGAAARQPGAPHPQRRGAGRGAAGDRSGCCSTSSACWARRAAEQVWGYLANYVRRCRARRNIPTLDRLVGHALAYPPRFRRADARAPRADRTARRRRCAISTRGLRSLQGGDIAEAAQNVVYEIGKAHFGKEALRDWFKALYETLLGSSQGPRMGSFIALYGVENTPPADRRGACHVTAPLPRSGRGSDRFRRRSGRRR